MPLTAWSCFWCHVLQGAPVFQTGYVEDSPLLPTPGEVFELRKLLPQVRPAGSGLGLRVPDEEQAPVETFLLGMQRHMTGFPAAIDCPVAEHAQPTG